jgi:hypothetical protein
MTMRFTLTDTARIMGHVRRKMEELQPNSMLPYEEAVHAIEIQRLENNAPQGHPPGFYVGECGQLKRIPNSIAYEQGDGGGSKNKEVITNPLKVTTVDAVDCDEVEETLVPLPPPVMTAIENTTDVDMSESEASEEATDEETEESNLESGGYDEA